MPEPVPDFSHQDALVAVMIAASASDESVKTTELLTIERIVTHLPVFAGFDESRIRSTANWVFDLLLEVDGLDQLWDEVRRVLPERLFETAYAMACDVAAADGTARESELRFLEEMRYELDIDRLHAAAIERGARARHMTA